MLFLSVEIFKLFKHIEITCLSVRIDVIKTSLHDSTLP